jgi:hypothetical protein
MSNFLDLLMFPIMYFFSGVWINFFKNPFKPRNYLEWPQRTHWWNNKHIKNRVTCRHAFNILTPGDPGANDIPMPFAHLPLIGGWKKYVVIEPVDHNEKWFTGWITEEVLGHSVIGKIGPVRVLEGPTPCERFGLNLDGRIIKIRVVGYGHIGDGSEYRKLALL